VVVARVDDLAVQLAERMLEEASVPVSENALSLVLPEASALAESVVLMEAALERARRRIAELAAVAGAARPRVVDFDPSRFGLALADRSASSGAAWSPGAN
jgi:hypothetical protein